MEKSMETMEKSIETMDNSMKTMGKLMNTLGKSVNTMEKPTKTMEKSMNSATGKILAPKFSKVEVLLQNVANSKEKCPRLKNKNNKNIQKKHHPVTNAKERVSTDD